MRPLSITDRAALSTTAYVHHLQVLDSYVVFSRQEPRSLAGATRFYCGRELVDAHSAVADTAATLEVLLAQVARWAGWWGWWQVHCGVLHVGACVRAAGI
jgi:DNA polymerase-3 subunit epsilon